MIIGNNNNSNNNNQFQSFINPNLENERIKAHTNVNSKEEMANKAYNMLEERYRNGLISLEEFTKKCKEIRKQN